MNKQEPRGTLHINLLRGKDIMVDGSAQPCLFVKIKVGSDTSWTEKPATSYQSPVFGKKFMGFNVRQSVIVEFQVINRDKGVDTVVGRGTYPIRSLSTKNTVIYVPLVQGGYLEVEMRYEVNEAGQEIKVPIKRPMSPQMPQQMAARSMHATVGYPQVAPTPFGRVSVSCPAYLPMQQMQAKSQTYPQIYIAPNYQQQQQQQPPIPQMPQMPPAYTAGYPIYPQLMQPIQYPNF